MTGARRDQSTAADDDPRLWSAEQLVAAERHERGALGKRLTRRRFVAQPCRWWPGEPRSVGIDQAAADVGDDWRPQRGELGHARHLDESFDAEVARMDLE